MFAIVGFVVSVGCRSDSECPITQACVNRECVSPCSYTQCGVNAECRVDGHRGRCFCLPQHFGDPQVRCERPQCLSDDECPTHLACRDQRCQDPCDCAPTAQCNVINHRPTCRCPPGYIGNPHQSCTIGKSNKILNLRFLFTHPQLLRCRSIYSLTNMVECLLLLWLKDLSYFLPWTYSIYILKSSNQVQT